MPSEQYTGRFKILVEQLQKSRQNGVERPLRSAVASALVAQCQSLYQDGGFKSFKDYVTAAEKAGIIQLGGSEDIHASNLNPPSSIGRGCDRVHVYLLCLVSLLPAVLLVSWFD